MTKLILESVPEALQPLYDAYSDQASSEGPKRSGVRNLLFMGPPLDVETFRTHVPRVVSAYNNFDAAVVTEIIPRIAESNEKFAGSLYRFGREASPGLWIELPASCTEKDADELVALLSNERELKPDELYVATEKDVIAWTGMWMSTLKGHEGDDIFLRAEQDPVHFRKAVEDLLELSKNRMFVRFWWD